MTYLNWTDDLRAEVEEFIEGFRSFDHHGEVTQTFLDGYCYWFAQILDTRFTHYDSYIIYEPIEGHFLTCIGDRKYDIRGDVTDVYANAQTYYAEELCFEIPSILHGCILKDGEDFDYDTEEP